MKIEFNIRSCPLLNEVFDISTIRREKTRKEGSRRMPQICAACTTLVVKQHSGYTGLEEVLDNLKMENIPF